jgi:hypothetical protein
MRKQVHQTGETDFRSVLPEDIDWKPFSAFPPSARLAIVVGEPSKPGPGLKIFRPLKTPTSEN